MSKFHTLAIKEIIKETKDAVSIEFLVPDNLKSEYLFVAGQYITLKATIGDDEVRRDYSLCSAPNEGKLKVVIKQVDGGQFSTYANNTFKVGDEIEVGTPNGRFILDPSKVNGNIVLFAAGSGITPIMSIIKCALEETSMSVVLVYCNKSPDSTIFRQQLQSLSEQYTNKFNIQFINSQVNIDGELFGRIDNSIVNFVIQNKFKNLQFENFYLCGPEEMIKVVKDSLIENAVSKDRIHYELFTASTDSSSEVIEVGDGMTEVTVLVDDEEESFIMSQNKTILEVALDNDVDAPYSCQGGVCSSCIAKIREGSATMRQNNILTDSELEDGYILTCQAQPTTPKIYIDYDDV